MQHFYYSKFDEVNWSWWKREAIPADMLSLLQSINNELKCYFPAKYLLYIYRDPYFLFISERNQVGRDNAGRTFSLRHFMAVQKGEINSSRSFREKLLQFQEPVDNKDPSSTTISYEQYSSIQSDVVFDKLVEGLLSGSKICLCNPLIDQSSGMDRKRIDQLNFFSFPTGPAFIHAVLLLPAELLPQLSFCLNYENDFIDPSKGKLGDVQLIYCGTKSIVESGFEVSHAIDKRQLEDRGFPVSSVVSSEQNQLKWHGLYTLLSGVSEDAADLKTLFSLWSRSTSHGLQEAMQFIVDYYQYMNGEDRQTGANFIRKVSLLKGIDAGLRTRIAKKYIETVHHHNIFEVVTMARDMGFGNEIKFLLQNRIDWEDAGLERLNQVIHDADFKLLPAEIRNDVFNAFSRQTFRWDDLRNDNIAASLKEMAYKKHRLSGLNPIWQEIRLDNYRRIKLTDAERILLLYDATGNREEFAALIESKFNENYDQKWLRMLGGHAIKIKIQNQSFNSLGGLLGFLRLVDIFFDHIKDASINEFKTLLKDFGNKLIDSGDISILFSSLRETVHFQDSAEDLKVVLQKFLPGFVSYQPDYLKKKLRKADPSGFNHELWYDAVRLWLEASNEQLSGFSFLNLVYLMRKSDFKQADMILVLQPYLSRIEPEVLHKIKKEGKLKLPEPALPDQPRQYSEEGNGKRMRKRIVITIPRWLLSKWFLWGAVSCIVSAIIIYYLVKNNTPRERAGKKEIVYPVKPPPQQEDTSNQLIKNAELFINEQFFGKGDTVSFYKFVDKEQHLGFIDFQFETDKFRGAKIRKVSKVAGQHDWNEFAELYKNSSSIPVEFILMLKGRDSCVTRINLPL